MSTRDQEAQVETLSQEDCRAERAKLSPTWKPRQGEEMKETNTWHLCMLLSPRSPSGIFCLPPCTRRQLIKESQFHIRAEHAYSPIDGSPGHHQEPHYNNHKILCVTIKPTAQEQHLNFFTSTAWRREVSLFNRTN